MSPFFMGSGKKFPGTVLSFMAGFANSQPTPALSQPNPVCEVASIKPNQSGDRPAIRSGAGGRLNATNATSKTLIELAYDVRDYQISGGPSWLGTGGCDIVATPEHPVDPTPDNIDYFRQMLRSLLADRFQLIITREKKELPLYVLVVAKDGSELKAVAKWQNPTEMRVHGGQGQLIGEKVSMTVLTQVLSDIAGHTLTDKTGLDGYYDFKLEWRPDETQPPAPGDPPSIFTAIQEQLGLKLESQKGLVEVLVVDRVEKPSAN
jgi:uncharacterized protein (TIGR03435 family)